MNRLVGAAILMASWVGVTASTAFAQAIVPQYGPGAPTMSPWLQLYNQNTGALDNYHSFVRPEIQLRNNLRQQQTAIQQQGDRLHGLRDDVRDLEKDGTTIRATGTNSVFMDYGHYYYSDIRSGAATVRGPGAARTANRTVASSGH